MRDIIRRILREEYSQPDVEVNIMRYEGDDPFIQKLKSKIYFGYNLTPNEIVLSQIFFDQQKELNDKPKILSSLNTSKNLLNKDKIASSLNQLEWWLYSYNGLGFQKLIDDKLSKMELKNLLRPDEIQKYTNGAKILKDANKITENEYKSFIKSLPSRTLVFTNDEGTIDANGKWNPVNKLNTSYSDIADLISTILITDKENGNEIANEIINVINTQGDIKQVLLKNKTNIKVLFNNYIESPKDILSFTKNVIKNSKSGEKIENNVATRLSNMGYTILYRGGDGDFVDMIFSIDIIVQSPESGVRTIQIKSNENQAIKFKDQFNNKGKHQAVDLLIYPLGDKYVIDSLRTNKTKTIPKLINP